MDDAAAIEKCRDGERDAFRHLVERYQRRAMGYAVTIVGNREDASDAVQDAFVDAFKALERFDGSRPFYPWFYVLLRNRCYKVAAKTREIDQIDEIEIVGPELRDEERLDVEKALRSLSKEFREILTLKYLDGLSYDELAEFLKIPKGTVMSRLFHARKQMQTALTRKFE